MTGHLGYEKNDLAGQGQGGGNVRNGSRPRTVLTDSSGPVEIDVPRDRAGTSEPQIVCKRQRRAAAFTNQTGRRRLAPEAAGPQILRAVRRAAELPDLS
jgi:transposase-like protein